MDIESCIYYLQTNKLSADDRIDLLQLGRGNHSTPNMVEKTVEVPLYGVLEFKGLFSESMTNNEIIDSVIKTFNGKHQQVKAFKKMNEGVGLLYPLSFAKVVK